MLFLLIAPSTGQGERSHLGTTAGTVNPTTDPSKSKNPSKVRVRVFTIFSFSFRKFSSLNCIDCASCHSKSRSRNRQRTGLVVRPWFKRKRWKRARFIEFITSSLENQRTVSSRDRFRWQTITRRRQQSAQSRPRHGDHGRHRQYGRWWFSSSEVQRRAFGIKWQRAIGDQPN